MSSHPNPPPHLRPLQPRAVEAFRGEQADLNATKERVVSNESVQPEENRTGESRRSEAAYRDINALPPHRRKLAVARAELANAFDAVMHEHWLRGNEAYSNVAVARACDIDEKQVRQWRENEKPMPAAAMVLFPGRLYQDVLAEVERMRGRGTKRSAVLLREALDGLGEELAREDARDARRVIDDGQRRLLEISARLTEGQ